MAASRSASRVSASPTPSSTSSLFPHHKKPDPRRRIQSYMDEATAQILYEFRAANTMEDTSMSSSRDNIIAVDSPHSPLSAMHACLETGKYSDLTIIHGETEWSAHRVVVASQSSVLEGVIEGLAQGQPLDLGAHDLNSVTLMIEYLYTSTYQPTPEVGPPDYGLDIHITMFALACTLSIPGLKHLAHLSFTSTLHNAITDLAIYFSAIRRIYTLPLPSSAAHPELRLVVVETATSELRKILSQPDIKQAFFAITTECPDFLSDVLSFLASNPNRSIEVETQILCPDCGPRDAGETYTVAKKCKKCGEKRVLEFF